MFAQVDFFCGTRRYAKKIFESAFDAALDRPLAGWSSVTGAEFTEGVGYVDDNDRPLENFRREVPLRPSLRLRYLRFLHTIVYSVVEKVEFLRSSLCLIFSLDPFFIRLIYKSVLKAANFISREVFICFEGGAIL